MRALVACECSGRVREALRRKGVTAISIDIQPSEDNSPYHLQEDVMPFLERYASSFDLLIAHPPCTFLANSGVRWLTQQGDLAQRALALARYDNMMKGAEFFAAFLKQPIPKIAVENPVMHKYGRRAIAAALGHDIPPTHFVQPWWFGDPAFKATGFTLKGLKPLVKGSNVLVPPKKGTPEHKKWSVIHQMSPSKNRAKERSRTFPGIAEAIADQWI